MSPRAYRLLFWVGLVLIVVVALGLLQSILLPFAAGFSIAYVLAPAVGRLERYRVPRSLASLAVLVAFLIGFALILLLLVPLVQGQVLQLIGKVPALVGVLQDQFGRLVQLLQEQLPAEDIAKLRELVGTKLGEAVVWIAGV